MNDNHFYYNNKNYIMLGRKAANLLDTSVKGQYALKFCKVSPNLCSHMPLSPYVVFSSLWV